MTMIVMLNNTIEYDEVRFHERHDSIISAVRSFATKLASAVDQAVVALILIISNIYAISQKNIIDERKYEELVAEIKSTNKKWFKIIIAFIKRNDSKSFKANGIECVGYSEKEVEKLVEKIKESTKNESE